MDFTFSSILFGFPFLSSTEMVVIALSSFFRTVLCVFLQLAPIKDGIHKKSITLFPVGEAIFLRYKATAYLIQTSYNEVYFVK